MFPSRHRAPDNSPFHEFRIVLEAGAKVLFGADKLGDRHRQCVERKRERLSVKIAVRDEQLFVDEDERVVGRGVQLDSHGPLGVVEEVAHGAVNLRRTAKRIRILNLVAPAMRFVYGRVFDKANDVRRRNFLAG